MADLDEGEQPVSVWTQHQIGAIDSGEAAIAVLPKNWKFDASRTGILYCHGYGGNALECRNAASQNMWTIVEALANAGFPVLSCDFGGDLWGNATAVARVNTAKAYLQSTLAAKGGKVALLGQSMGHLTAMNWAAQNLAATSCVFSSMGVCDLNDIYGNATYTASINSAYGGSYSNATQGATYNPAVNTASKYAGLPWLSYRGASDTTASPATASSLAAGIGATAASNTVTGQHDWATVGSFPVQKIVDFFTANAA